MDRLERMILKAENMKHPPLMPWERLAIDNEYLENNCLELLDFLCPESVGGYRAPEKGTKEWAQFMYAIIHSVSEGGLTE